MSIIYIVHIWLLSFLPPPTPSPFPLEVKYSAYMRYHGRSIDLESHCLDVNIILLQIINYLTPLDLSLCIHLFIHQICIISSTTVKVL